MKIIKEIKSWEEMKNKVIYGDCFDVMKKMPDRSVNAIITDPPYGVLGNHKIETKIDKEKFFSECKRILKDDGFLAYFGVMPTLLEWENEARKFLRFKDHISWVKRINSSPFHEILKTHEEIMIYTKNKPQKYCETKGKYTDIKIEGIFFDIATIDGLKRHFSSLYYEIKTGKKSEMQPSKSKTQESGNGAISFKKLKTIRTSEFVNFTNVWSFLPENIKNRNGKTFCHPTVKPLKLLRRLIILLTKEGDLVFDPFGGSFTTAHSAEYLSREWISCEILKEYCDLGGRRNDKYILSGKLIDMTLETPKKFSGAKRGKGGISYRRKQFDKKGEHYPVFEVPGKQMEEFVWEKIMHAMKNPEVFVNHYLSKKYTNPTKIQKLENELSNLRQQKINAEVAIARIEQAYENGAYSEEKMCEKVEQKNNEITEIENKTQETEDELSFMSSINIEVQKLKEASKQVKYRLENLTRRQKKIICDLFIDRIEMRRRKLNGKWDITADIFFRFNPDKFPQATQEGRTAKPQETNKKNPLNLKKVSHGVERLCQKNLF